MKLILLIFFLTFALFAQNGSFSKSKKQLRQIYQGYENTFYCDCKYNYKDMKNMIDRKSCGYIPRNEISKKGNINLRARQIEWEHIIPAENFGRQFSCWYDGDGACVVTKGKNKGKEYRGRRCCNKVNKRYKIMQADMHNLVPAIGELNGDRKNFRFDFEAGQSGQYGECKFNVLFKDRRARVREELRGVIARTYLYFNQKYEMKLSKQELRKYQAWNKQYPPDAWEIERNKRIAKVQGNLNEFIK